MAYRSMTRDRSVKGTKVGWELVRRILGYARPYRAYVWMFLITLVFASLLSVAQPLLFRRIIDNGITVKDAHVVTVTAIIIAVRTWYVERMVRPCGRFCLRMAS